ncbi:hypothetical protein BZM27_32825 [Paraburkholderia steynii]|uniref:Uncharacterized protein n=1 Tax=Paraburkholderia steynii TaxID=1245441 RepID=A0A4R0X6E7_9BURK|nr:hypothetical protein BZM27_32825 [Paraburkholderia steynii]
MSNAFTWSIARQAGGEAREKKCCTQSDSASPDSIPHQGGSTGVARLITVDRRAERDTIAHD